MKTVFIVYKEDDFHSVASRDLMGIATSEEEAMKIIRNEVKNDGLILSDDDEHMLHSSMQTQGYEGEGEFRFQEFNVNQLIN